MMIRFASILLLATGAAAQCDGRSKTVDYGSSSTSALAKSDSDGGFTAPSTGDFLCTLNCDQGSNLNLYVKYTTSGQASSSNFDAKIEGGSCGSSVESQNTAGASGIKIYVEAAAGYQNLKLVCECRNTAGGGCFSGSDTVIVMNRGEVAMKDLQVGDKVLTGSNTYEPVYSFGHYHDTMVADFVRLQTKEDSLELTANHLIFANSSPIRADQVVIGDNLSSGTVKKVSSVQKQGLYMPLTPSGKILVNNMEASAYISMAEYAPIQSHPLLKFWLSEHFLSHLWLSPFRMYCMGISSTYCPNHVKNVDGDEGVMGFLLMGKKVAEFSLEQNLLVQILIGVPVFLSLLAFYAVESITGPSMAPLFILAVVACMMKLKTSVSKKQKTV